LCERQIENENKDFKKCKNETIQLYKLNIYEIYTYLQKEWLDLPNTWIKPPTTTPKTWLFFTTISQ